MGGGKIEIKTEEIEVVSQIIVDGIEYPLTPWNMEKATKYLNTGEKEYLDELKNFSLEI